jgi:YggT family protein
MSTAAEILGYIVQTVFGFYLVCVLLRLLLQLARADFYNPISQFVVRVTSPLLVPLRRMIPPLGRLDTATLVLALAVQLVAVVAVLALYGHGPGNLLLVLAWSLVGIGALLVKMYFFAILALIIFSWVAPQANHPALALLYQLTEPVMAPFRRLLPPVGGLDLSPILVFVVINVLEILLRGFARELGLPAGLVLGI